MSTEGGGPANKHWWGPRVWRILHSLAEISDRTDCGPAWAVVLRETANMLPCTVCRAHFHEHIRGLHLSVGRAPREELRRWLWNVHRETGGALPFEDLSGEYGQGGNREAVFQTAAALIGEIYTGFRDNHVLDRFTVGHLASWHRGALTLARLLQAPEQLRTRARYGGRV